ncbi:MAG: bifunctional D-glycero-beta-D-manno-heptose-7-phosphate kinase/D-glycero-beta-D-manno-heptose 1-phosphate adenylyltransferase HldE [Chromatiales bacterium]|nr:bifunctional D-glycero-beta-D-manno-heptose-7-phosphate kinase/D-glycero-beta-D-manno-heptose 1-phosphate adenylyltransferase HldE [Chromatiales bacterium]
MTDIVPDFRRARVLVAGDVMLDRYWSGDTSRISPEAPVPVVLVQGEQSRPGGAGNVAANLAAVGAHCRLVGLTGQDEDAKTLTALLEAQGVRTDFVACADRPTARKLRVVSRHQQLLRMDFEAGASNVGVEELTDRFTHAVADHDVVVLSDYAKGALADIRRLIEAARTLNRPVLVDPKGTDFARYCGASFITPNLMEFHAVVGKTHDETELTERAQRLVAELGLDGLLITRGERGMTLVEAGEPPLTLPTEARDVFDVTGAGDTVIAIMAAAMAAGAPLHDAVRLANRAAGLVVGKLGTATVSADELATAGAMLGPEKIVDEATLLAHVAQARKRGERIVFTNGCFDILHAGHVQTLQQAARFGDRLVVATNVDQTVRDLKGEGRPVNPLEQRMTVLAAIGCVDWVVAFTEPTPERLICALLPDVLVKGGDNDLANFIGADCVRAAGGELRVVGYLDGCSTTKTIERIVRRPS